MDKQLFVVEFSPSTKGRVKRIKITYKALVYLLSTFVLLVGLGCGLFSSYLQMAWKMANYNELATNFDRLRTRYQELQKISRQHNEQMASLEVLASEVSVAYGVNRPNASNSSHAVLSASSEQVAMPAVNESLAEYNFLKAASLGGPSRYAGKAHLAMQPSLWPIEGLLRSSFGGRSDPFSGEGAFHSGIDISAPVGTPVHVTADGVIASAGWSNGYGKLIVVDHGNGFRTYYAHLSRFSAVPGEEVRRGQIIANSGSTGRSTGPHIHYEVRLAGTPVNPYRYLSSGSRVMAKRARTILASSNDLGL